MSTRAAKGQPWTEPVNLGSAVNSELDEYNPCLSGDGLELYFVHGQWDPEGAPTEVSIYVTRRATMDDPWGEPEALGPVVNSQACQDTPWISSDGRVLMFTDVWICDPRPGGYGCTDIWLSRRTDKDSEWGEPVNVGAPVNTAAYEDFPRIAADGSMLYFNSSRGGGSGSDDLWQAPILPVVDFDQDEKIGMSDLVTMIQNWGTDEQTCDIGPMPWGDGVVDAADLEVLMKYWDQEMYPPVGLIGHWMLDETDGLTAYDNLGNNDGTLMGTPVWQPEAGIIDGALALDGVDDYVVIDRILNPLRDLFSVFAWIKGGEPGQVIVSQQYGANWLMADAAEGRLMTELGVTGDGSELYWEMGITDGDWRRIGFTWDGSNRRLYVDDVLAVEDAQTGLASSFGRHYIGCGNDRVPGTFFSGLIDDIRIYNRSVNP